MSEKQLKEIFEVLKTFGTFGIAFFNSKSNLTFGNLTDEYNQLATAIIEKLFESMKISDFLQRAITELMQKCTYLNFLSILR